MALPLQLEVYNVVEKAYLAKEASLGQDSFRQAEQWFYLQTVDALWKDHLLTMDHLRQGIGLRGYGQKDPKQEYKKEGFELFRVLLGRISRSVVSTLLRVEPKPSQDQSAAIEAQRRAALQKQARVLEAQANAAASVSTASANAKGASSSVPVPAPVKRAEPKVGRNDPCPCGSGQKYKKCHGLGTAEATAE